MAGRTVGQIGLGSLGREFVPHLRKKFGFLTIFDRDPSRVAPLVSHDVKGAKSSREVGGSSDVVLLCLPDPDAVRAVPRGATASLATARQTLEEVIASVIEGDLGKVSFSVDLRYKDFRLTSDLVREMGVPMRLAAYATEFYQGMRARGMGGMEMNNMVPYFADLAGVDIYKGGRKPAT